MDEEENDVLFKFNKPDGSFLLHVETPAEESGWEVHPDREPMEVCFTCIIMYISIMILFIIDTPECSG